MTFNAASPISFTVFPPAEALRGVVKFFRIAEYRGPDALAIRVCPNGSPGIVFQQGVGDRTAIRDIVTASGRLEYIPPLFLYGHVTELSVMNFREGPFTTIQAILEPTALGTLFRIDASSMANNSWGPADFADDETLPDRLRLAETNEERVAALSELLLAKLEQAEPPDPLVQESLRVIQEHIEQVTVKFVLDRLHLSERQFEKRFFRAVGVSPQFYIRVRRFNEAIRRMDTGEYDRLSDVAHSLHFHDQSHFIRDMKQFSGITPKSISQKVNHFHHDQIGNSYLL
ncbi:AraC family transcriptional regulator [Paenibacillus sp.]|uniref:helix-turn-helix domain-containing protein n=1 Tax=Paenibacillus sp. TaxID=58172 RepID=UPI002D57FF5C|nr:AraC family transcriptional regulator [Paenibacillus sp.]HZG57229.1 AraC family transcriptional regulator [Paenibacillus sp.]